MVKVLLRQFGAFAALAGVWMSLVVFSPLGALAQDNGGDKKTRVPPDRQRRRTLRHLRRLRSPLPIHRSASRKIRQ